MPLVVNAADPADLDVVALGVVMAEEAGQTVLCRTGPSFTWARAASSAGPAAAEVPVSSSGPWAAETSLLTGWSWWVRVDTQRTTEQM